MTSMLKTLAAATLLATALTVNAADEKKSAPAKPYPMETCAVSGEKLGGMGEAFVFVFEGQEIKLCCKDCKKDFDKDPKKFMAKVTEANKKVKPYTAKTCLLSGEAVGEDAPATVYKGQEFKFCCKNCLRKFEKEPAKYAAKLEKK